MEKWERKTLWIVGVVLCAVAIYDIRSYNVSERRRTAACAAVGGVLITAHARPMCAKIEPLVWSFNP